MTATAGHVLTNTPHWSYTQGERPAQGHGAVTIRKFETWAELVKELHAYGVPSKYFATGATHGRYTFGGDTVEWAPADDVPVAGEPNRVEDILPMTTDTDDVPLADSAEMTTTSTARPAIAPHMVDRALKVAARLTSTADGIYFVSAIGYAATSPCGADAPQLAPGTLVTWLVAEWRDADKIRSFRQRVGKVVGVAPGNPYAHIVVPVDNRSGATAIATVSLTLCETR